MRVTIKSKPEAILSSRQIRVSIIQTHLVQAIDQFLSLQNQQNLRATVEAYDTVQLWDGRTVDSRAVAPGDVIIIPKHGCTMHLDAALLTGAAVLNESMLTGKIIQKNI